MFAKLAIEIEKINYPCDFYIGNEVVAKINNSSGLIEVINIMLRKGARKEDMKIQEYEDVEFEEIKST